MSDSRRDNQNIVDEFEILWPNCSVADCCNKICLGVSDSLCTPHYFNLPMDSEGNAVYPDEATREAVCEEIQLRRPR
jgi:hypothetical protein